MSDVCGKESVYCQGGADSGEHEHVERVDLDGEMVERRYTHTHEGETIEIRTFCVLPADHHDLVSLIDENGKQITIRRATPCDYQLPGGGYPAYADPKNPATHEEAALSG